MRKPNESLDQFIVKATPKAAELPAPVSLHLTGEVEVLKPLETSEAGKRGARISWFQLGLGVAGGVAMIAMILLSAVLIEISDAGSERARLEFDSYLSDEALDEQPDGTLNQVDTPSISDIFPASSPFGIDQLPVARATSRVRRSKPRARLAAYRPPHRIRHTPVVTEFVPTTLVIYAEDGEIKTRIERHISAVYKKPLS